MALGQPHGTGFGIELRQRRSNTYSSYNGIAKVDHTFNSIYNLSVRYFGGGGDQVAQINSPYLPYFQEVPSRLHNVSVVSTDVFTSRLVNQLVAGYNYFLQRFNSFDLSADPPSMGLNTGVTDPSLAGPPNITINGFAGVGGTQPLGRVEKTLHFTDSMTYSTGAHQIKVGGEVRFAKLFVFYDSNNAARSPLTAPSGRGRRCRQRPRVRRSRRSRISWLDML